MLTMLIKYLNVSLLITTWKVVRNYPEIIRDFKDSDYDEMTEIEKILTITIFILIMTITAIPLTFKQEFLDS